MKLKNTALKIIGLTHDFEKYLLVFFLSVMIVFSFLQIILRTFFKAVEWFDSLVRYSVLWAGMIAASIATYEKKHIRIDLIGKFAKGRFKSVIYLMTNAFASAVSILLCVISWIYLISFELTSTDPAPFLGIKRWVLLLIIPISFGTIGLRFLLRSLVRTYELIKNIDEDENKGFDIEI